MLTPENRQVVLDTVKVRATSQKFLVALCAFTLSLLLRLTCLPNSLLNNIVGSYDDLLHNIGIDAEKFFISYDEISKFAGAFKTIISVATVIIVLYWAFCCASLWCIFIFAKQGKVHNEILGIRILKYVSVAFLFITCLVITAFLAINLFLIINPHSRVVIGSGNYRFGVGDDSILVLLLSFVIIVFLGLVAVFYLIKVIKTTNKLKNTLSGSELSKIPPFPALVNTVFSIFQILPMIACLYISANMDGSFMVPFFSDGLLAFSLISFSTMSAGINSDISKLLRRFKPEDVSSSSAFVSVQQHRAEPPAPSVSPSSENQHGGNEAFQQDFKKEKFTVLIGEDITGEENSCPVRCEMCGKYYDSSLEHCPYCLYENSTMNTDYSKIILREP